jgi:hypothetical protein
MSTNNSVIQITINAGNSNMFPKSTLALALVVALTACDSSSDSDSSGSNSASATTYTVIDGYLSDADVCVIDPDDADEICIEIGSTDENGQIEISSDYDGYTVVADVVAGLAQDSDDIGYVTHSYEMRSAEGSTVVTPYTTIAALNDDYDLVDIAATLDDVTEDDISGDYTSNTRAHLIAQLLADHLETDTSSDDTAELLTIAEAASTYLNNYTDTAILDIELNYNEDDGITASTSIGTLTDYLSVDSDESSSDFYSLSLNGEFFDDEGVFSMAHDADGSTATLTTFDEAYTGSYSIDDATDSVTYTFDDPFTFTDTYIYESNEFSLAVSAENDIIATSKTDLGSEVEAFTTDELSGTTWYYLENVDDGNNLTTATINFTSDSYVVVTTSGLTFGTSYSLDSAGMLNISTFNWNFEKVIGNDDMTLVYSDNSEAYALFIADKNFYENLIDKWDDITADTEE